MEDLPGYLSLRKKKSVFQIKINITFKKKKEKRSVSMKKKTIQFPLAENKKFFYTQPVGYLT